MDNESKPRRDKNAVPRRPVLDQRKKELMLAVFLQNPKAFQSVRETLKPETFSKYDVGFATLWKLAGEFFDQHQQLPDKELLMAEVEDACNVDPNLLKDTEQEALTEFMDFAFDETSFKRPVSTDQVYADWAVKQCQKFLDERIAIKTQMVIKEKDQVATNMPSLLAGLQAEAEQAAAMSADDVTLAFPEGWDQQVALNLFPTNVQFIDKFLGGGHAAGEVYGLLGPYGSCKTTLISMMAAESAHYFAALANRADYDEQPTVAFWVSYEAEENEMRQRSLGYAAQVPRRTMETLKSMEKDLSRTGDLRNYEKRLFRDYIQNGYPVLGEYERVKENINVFNKHMCFMDMTGKTRKGVGGGGIPEIARRINHELRNRSARCGVVFVDYVIAMAKRFMAANNVPNDQLRHYIGSAPLEAKSRIGSNFGVPVWIVQQLSGDANSRSPASLPDHTDSAEAKNFAENLDFSFSIGKPQQPDNVSLFGCTKHRRQPGKESTIIQVHSTFNRVMCADDKYTLNPHMKRIISRYDNNKLPADARQQVTPAAQENPVDVDMG